MSTHHANSFYNWCLSGTLAGSLILGGSVLSQAGPLTFSGKSKGTPPAQTEMQKQLAKRDRAATLGAAGAVEDRPVTAEESGANAEARIAQSAKTIKLNFLESSWANVLSSYAEQAGVKLVVEPNLVPRSRFTRRDRSFYTQGDALNILNKELFKFDLKLVTEGERLVLRDIHKMAPNYRRPPVSGTVLTPQHELPESSLQAAFPDRQPKRISQVETADAEEAPISGEAVRGSNSRIQLTAGTATSPYLDPNEANLLQIPIRNRKSKDIANVLYRAFEKNCELINNGPDDLPAIRVYDPLPKTKQVAGRIPLAPPKRTVRFTLAMDHAQSQMTIQAPASTARAVAGMVRKLDTTDDRGETVRLFSSERGDQVEATAEMVQDQLNRMARARRMAPPIDKALAFQGDNLPQDEAQPDAQAEEQDPRPRQPARGDAGQPAEKGLSPDLLGGIKGDVTVESVPELGVMILRGNQKDVDQVMTIIREIEKLSAGTAPDVHLVLLKNSNSEALAELLTQVYERLNGRRQRGATGGQAANASQQVSVIPVVKPNAILIVASSVDMESLLKLTEELDQPVDPLAEFQMFRLKSAVASQVLETIETFYADRKGLGSRVLAVADVRTNGVLVHARPSDLKEVAALIKEIDLGEVAAVNQMKIIPLKNAVA